jgi:hypothetical protein
MVRPAQMDFWLGINIQTDAHDSMDLKLALGIEAKLVDDKVRERSRSLPATLIRPLTDITS